MNSLDDAKIKPPAGYIYCNHPPSKNQIMFKRRGMTGCGETIFKGYITSNKININIRNNEKNRRTIKYIKLV